MNHSINDEVDALLGDAVDAHGAGVQVDQPDIGALLADRQRRHTRRVAVASVAVLAIGVGGLVAASLRSDETARVIEDERPTGSTAPAATLAPEWFCTGRLGTSDDGRSLFGDCEPGSDRGSTDWSCDDRQGIDDVGRTRFSDCVPVGQLGPLPREYSSSDGLDGITPGELNPIGYTMQAGDVPQSVATMFCTDIDRLQAVNGWSDVATGWPTPGTRVQIPRLDARSCAELTHVVQVGDYPIAIADQYCIPIEALFVFNAFNEQFSTLLPGSEVFIPPTMDGAC